MSIAKAPGRARTFAIVALLFAGAAQGLSIPPEPGRSEPPETAFEAAIDVSLLSWVVRVVDVGGSPILGLRPEDLRVRVGKQEVPVVGLDWIAPGTAGGESTDASHVTTQ